MATEIKTGVFTYNGEDVEFNFVTDISAVMRAGLVASVTDSIIVDGHYHSVLKDIVFDMQLINVMTDIDAEKYDAGEFDDFGDIEKFVTETKVADIIKANAVPGLVRYLEDAVDKDIEYKTGIHTSPVADALSSLIKTIEQKAEKIDVDSLMDMAQTFSDATGELTADKMIEAYANSSMFQKLKDDVLDKREERWNVISADFPKAEETADAKEHISSPSDKE